MKYYNYDNFEKEQKYYHGTSTALNISNFLLPPTETDCIREDYRKNNRDLVYITSSLGSAERYAWKAVKKFGGKPIIYQVEPDWSSLVNRIDCEYITYSAKIISSIDFKNF